MVTIRKKAFGWGLRVLAVALGGALVAKATVMTLGTKWHIHNDTGRALTLACDADGEGAGGEHALRSLEIPAHSTLDYNWGDGFSGDALGAPLGRFSCRAGAGGLLADVGTFSADSREAVTLRLVEDRGVLVLQKSSSDRSAIARGTEADKHDSATN